MDIVLTRKDVEWLSTQHPGLKINKRNKLIEGDIFVDRAYNNVALAGVFPIKIELFNRGNSILPKVYIASDKLQKIARKINKDDIDIHVNYDQSLCMVVSEKERECFQNGFTLQEFFENCIEPYFYWIMHYEKYGMKPWGEYAHRELAYFEMHAANEMSYEELVKKFNLYQLHQYLQTDANGMCLCGSTMPMKLCHSGIHKGLTKMQQIRMFREHQIKRKQVINIPIASTFVYNLISQKE